MSAVAVLAARLPCIRAHEGKDPAEAIAIFLVVAVAGINTNK